MHRIRRQILDLELPREKGATDLARRASRLFQEKVVPGLDKLFTQIAPGDQIIRIQRLEIDLDYLSEGRFDTEFVDVCLRQIEQQIKNSIADSVVLQDQYQVAQFSVEEKTQAVWSFFMQYGLMPWYAADWSVALLTEKIQALPVDTFQQSITQFTQMSNALPSFWQRLISQFSIDLSTKVIETVFKLPPKAIHAALNLHQSMRARPLDIIQCKQFLLAIAVTADRTVFQQPLSFTPLAAWVQTYVEPMLTPRRLTTESITPDKKDTAKKSNHTTADSGMIPQTKQDTGSPFTAEKKITPLPEPDKILIQHAGQVLLGPFMPALFENLGLIWTSDYQIPAWRATYLLHYLATGIDTPEEPALLLPKILCGLDWDAPVPIDIGLTTAEKNECENLLRALIGHWPVLKNTSPDGLRSGFLQREGLLYFSEGRQAWVVQIERTGLDLLLDHIPWSFSAIKHGWMEKMVMVEW